MDDELGVWSPGIRDPTDDIGIGLGGVGPGGLVPLMEHRPGVLGVVGLIEDETVGESDVPYAQQECHGGDKGRDDPARVLVGHPTVVEAFDGRQGSSRCWHSAIVKGWSDVIVGSAWDDSSVSKTQPGRVILAGTPIGDRRSASPALIETLRDARVIAAEDTRRLRDLLRRLGVESSARVVSYFEGNESARTPELINCLRDGDDVVVVTDAGMPSVSDPGYRLVTAAIEHGIVVTSVPGPTAVTTALAISGLPTDRFCFEGFLPRKPGERRRRLAELAQEPRTTVLYEAPHRLADLLDDAADVLGTDRRAAVCRELTKTYEEVRRGGLGELAEWAREHARGEITIVIEGAPGTVVGIDEAAEMVAELTADGIKRSKAVAQVARATGVDRHELYDAAQNALTTDKEES